MDLCRDRLVKLVTRIRAELLWLSSVQRKLNRMLLLRDEILWPEIIETRIKMPEYYERFWPTRTFDLREILTTFYVSKLHFFFSDHHHRAGLALWCTRHRAISLQGYSGRNVKLNTPLCLLLKFECGQLYKQRCFVVTDCGWAEEKKWSFETYRVVKISRNIQAFWFLFRRSQVMEFRHTVITFCYFITMNLLFQETVFLEEAYAYRERIIVTFLQHGFSVPLLSPLLQWIRQKTFSHIKWENHTLEPIVQVFINEKKIN